MKLTEQCKQRQNCLTTENMMETDTRRGEHRRAGKT